MACWYSVDWPQLRRAKAAYILEYAQCSSNGWGRGAPPTPAPPPSPWTPSLLRSSPSSHPSIPVQWMLGRSTWCVLEIDIYKGRRSNKPITRMSRPSTDTAPPTIYYTTAA